MKNNILFTSVGRRVELINLIQSRLSPDVTVVAADSDPNAVALHFAKIKALLPIVSAQDFPGRLLDVCQLHQISHVFPLIDTELPIYASLKQELSLFGVELVVSDRFTIDLTRDKFSFGLFLQEKQISTPRVFSKFDELDSISTYCVRRRFGSRSVDMKQCTASEATPFLKKRDWIVTEWKSGIEYSVDGIAENGIAKICVPRIRNLIRDGESIIGTTDKNLTIIEMVNKVVSFLPGLYGPFCLQGIFTENEFYITELNARFGGGIVLSEMSGAGFSEWILSKINQSEFIAPEWINGKRMTRYLKCLYE